MSKPCDVKIPETIIGTRQIDPESIQERGQFISLTRVCVPIGLSCNLKCGYCYRKFSPTINKVPRLNDRMRRFLSCLDPTKTEALTASGGEPLLYTEQMLEMFSYAPKGIHGKIMTNGCYLTQPLIDLINNDEFEVHFSHDGVNTILNRGVDVLEDKNIANLVKQIKTLRINSVVTNNNPDPIANYERIVDLLDGRTDFHYTSNIAYDVGERSLVEGFDYEKYAERWHELSDRTREEKDTWMYNRSRYETEYFPDRPKLRRGLDVLPNGTLCDMSHMTTCGDIFTPIKVAMHTLIQTGLYDFCLDRDCPIGHRCCADAAVASEHFCKTQEKIITFRDRYQD